MRRKRLTAIFLMVLIAGMAFYPSCDREREAWKPEVKMLMQPDSGLTTSIFELRLEVPNLPSSQSSVFSRWDLNGDSVWDEPFTADRIIYHRFYSKGTHRIKAEVLTEDGQRIILSKQVKVDQGYSAPQVSFKTDPPVGNYLTEFTFDASATFDDEDPFSSLLFRWDFEDDGLWDTEPGNVAVVKHIFNKTGIYKVRLGVTDPTRRTATTTRILEVNMHDDRIVPDFKWIPLEATVKDTFILDASATRHSADSLRVFTYQWEIKGEQKYGPFTDPVFQHVFWSSGMQEVTLCITDQFGLTNSLMKEFYVIKENKPPNPAIKFATPYGNTSTNFYISAWPSTDDVTAPSKLLIRWDFEGDGTWDTGWSYEKLLYHQFALPGTYWVTLEAEDEGGERAVTKSRLLVSASTSPTGFIVDPRDGNFYGTVKIGDQWWMSDNLDCRTAWKIVKDIPMLQKCYDEENGMCDLYGSLYQGERSDGYFDAGFNICPDGWRLPSKKDWEALAKQAPPGEGREAFMVGGSLGFNARMTGYGRFEFIYFPYTQDIMDTLYYFYGLYQQVQFLSTTRRPFLEHMQSQFYFGLNKNYDGVNLSWGELDGYFYARCIKKE